MNASETDIQRRRLLQAGVSMVMVAGSGLALTAYMTFHEVILNFIKICVCIMLSFTHIVLIRL